MVKVIKELAGVHKLSFHLSVLGQNPLVATEFKRCREEVSDLDGVTVVKWGEIESRNEYLAHLGKADIVLSTAHHEFLGLAVLEAVCCGCLPVCPKKLSYPELFPKDCLYSTERQLVKKLRHFIRHPELARKCRFTKEWQDRLKKFQWEALSPRWDSIILC